MVRKKLNLENKEILLVEAFLAHNSRTKGPPNMQFLQNNSPEQYYTKDFQRNLLKKLSNKLEISLGHFSNRAGRSEYH